jgi:hypothetical protein
MKKAQKLILKLEKMNSEAMLINRNLSHHLKLDLKSYLKILRISLSLNKN